MRTILAAAAATLAAGTTGAATVDFEGVPFGLYGGDQTVAADDFVFEASDFIVVDERGLSSVYPLTVSREDGRRFTLLDVVDLRPA